VARQNRLFPDSMKFDEKRFALIGSVRGDLSEALEKNDTVQIVITAHQKRVGVEWMEDERVVLTSYLQVDHTKILSGDDVLELPEEGEPEE
jgi:hypothetical protein